MKLLICTQKVDRNDPILGFFHRWLEEFSKNAERVIVICLEKGECGLPSNVEVLSLGKEEGISRLKYIFRFYKYIWQKRAEYSHIFVHMNQIYVILGGLFWRMCGKNISFWYTHRQVTITLWLAEKITHKVFTASKESFRLKSKKLSIVGHGIDFEKFSDIKKNKSNIINIFHIGRITKIKNIETLIKASAILMNKWNRKFKINFVGSPITKEDFLYQKDMENLIKENKLEHAVHFLGSVSNDKITQCYSLADLTVNMVPTGGLDKTVLESMASGVPALSSNQGFLDYFGQYGDILSFRFGNPEDLADKIINFFELNDVERVTLFIKEKVKKNAGLENLIGLIVREI